MFGSIGGPEIILIFVVALIVFGPRRLPEIGRKVGRVVGDLRKATGELRASVEREIGFDPAEGLQEAGRARREIISTLSEPIRDVTKGTMAVVRGAPKELAGKIREESEAGSDPEGRVSGDEPARPAGAVSRPDSPAPSPGAGSQKE